jgi:hypothetical protein
MQLSVLVLALPIVPVFGSTAESTERPYLACLPERLHPVSAQILQAFLDGRLTERDFRWGFHLPNSDYLPVGECILLAIGSKTPVPCDPPELTRGLSGFCS